VVARWFTRHRGKAMGIAAVATSLGGSVIVPFMAFNLERYGWRMALIIQGVLTVVIVGALAVLVVRSRPQDLGLLPDGDREAPAGAQDVASGPRWTMPQVLKTRDFWCIGLSVGLTFAINQSVLASIIPYATATGIGLKQATLLVSCMAIGSIIGKLAFGAIADRSDKRWLLLIAIACTVLQLAVLIAQPSFPVLLVICALAGLAIGGELPVWAALVAERFGPNSFGSVLGMMNPINMALSLVAIGFIGRSFDRTGSYTLALEIFIGVALLAAVLVLLISRRGTHSARPDGG
jgi:sugar phosphate permease